MEFLLLFALVPDLLVALVTAFGDIFAQIFGAFGGGAGAAAILAAPMVVRPFLIEPKQDTEDIPWCGKPFLLPK